MSGLQGQVSNGQIYQLALVGALIMRNKTYASAKPAPKQPSFLSDGQWPALGYGLGTFLASGGHLFKPT